MICRFVHLNCVPEIHTNGERGKPLSDFSRLVFVDSAHIVVDFSGRFDSTSKITTRSSLLTSAVALCWLAGVHVCAGIGLAVWAGPGALRPDQRAAPREGTSSGGGRLSGVGVDAVGGAPGGRRRRRAAHGRRPSVGGRLQGRLGARLRLLLDVRAARHRPPAGAPLGRGPLPRQLHASTLRAGLGGQCDSFDPSDAAWENDGIPNPNFGAIQRQHSELTDLRHGERR